VKLDFIPQPKEIRTAEGVFRPSDKHTIGVSSHELYPIGCALRLLLGAGPIGVAVEGVADVVSIVLDPALRPGGYKVHVTPKGMALRAQSVAAAFHAVQTLGQAMEQSPKGTLPALAIDDWPDFRDRGVYYDVSRGRVPTLERLKEQADLLARHKINQFQLYIEHTFRFRRHPDIGKDASPLTAEDILELDAWCRERHVDLVPSLSTFGHLEPVLSLPRYQHLAESFRTGGHWSLAPANPETTVFLKELFDEFLPCFSSDRFNVCCDEVWDLGDGQSGDLAREIGKGRLYLRHIQKLRDLAAAHGKRIMLWGDIIRNYPELIPDIPKDATCLDWGYDADTDFDRVEDFTATGLATYVCPSVSGHVTLFPRIHEAAGNIAGWARAGRKHGAAGLLNTDWGDGGHYNFMECAWPGYLFGAEQAWNADADQESFLRRFAKLFLKIEAEDFVDALAALGEVAHVSVPGHYQSMWRHVYFAPPGDDVFRPACREAKLCENGRLRTGTIEVNAAYGRATADTLKGIRETFRKHARRRGADPHEILPYWLFAVDALLHAAEKLAVLGEGGDDSPATRRSLRRDMTRLMERFQELWMARNRKSEIEITLGYYQDVLKAL